MSKLSKRKRVRSSQGEARPFEGMSQVNVHAAGVAIGAHEIMVCVPDGDDQQLVRAFGTYTADLDALADWFIDRAIETAAMESTGVYWIPLFETLEARGIQCCLISAQAIKHVPGRKSNVLDCHWIHSNSR
jgi:transposase